MKQPLSCHPLNRPHVLVLWDIDHTLIKTQGVGFAICQQVFPAATGRPLDQMAQISGRTEPDIMRETLRVNGVEPTDDAIDSLAAALVQGYEDARNELATTGRALPGAVATLRRLAADPRVHQAVLTGNLRDGCSPRPSAAQYRFCYDRQWIHSEGSPRRPAHGDDLARWKLCGSPVDGADRVAPGEQHP